MARFLLDSFDNGSVKEYLHTNTDGRMVGVETTYSDEVTEGVLDRNQAIRNARGSEIVKGFHHVASIPRVLWDRWYKETKGEIARDKKLLMMYLRSRDFSKVRTSDKL